MARDQPNFQPSSGYLNSVTWIAPYYRSFNGFRSIYYRETNESSLLQQVNSDIQRSSLTSFKATNLFLVTYISPGMKFQVTLATDRKETFTVMNYEELEFEPFNIDMNEPGCGYKVLAPRIHALKTMINGNATGVRGRHVFNLTTPGCYRNVSGLRADWSSIRFGYYGFRSIEQKFPLLLKPNELGEVLFHLKEPIAPTMNPNVIINLKKIANKPSSQFALSNPGNLNAVSLTISNLFVLKNTVKSSSFQYGDVELGVVASKTKCREIQFNEQMNSIPAIKVNARINNVEIKNFVNIWLKNVSTVGFTACVKEMVTFSGTRKVNVSYVAATSGSDFTQEATHFIHKSTTDVSDTCINKNLQNEYLNTPYIFTAIETVGNTSEPVLVWVKNITQTKTRVCVRSSQKAKYRIHLIVKGTISPCSNYSCPNHLECQLDSASMPYCGCIRNCARYNDTREFCGSDYRNYQSVCLMNKEHCHRYGNKSKSNVTVNHYGKCQGLL